MTFVWAPEVSCSPPSKASRSSDALRRLPPTAFFFFFFFSFFDEVVGGSSTRSTPKEDSRTASSLDHPLGTKSRSSSLSTEEGRATTRSFFVLFSPRNPRLLGLFNVCFLGDHPSLRLLPLPLALFLTNFSASGSESVALGSIRTGGSWTSVCFSLPKPS